MLIFYQSLFSILRKVNSVSVLMLATVFFCSAAYAANFTKASTAPENMFIVSDSASATDDASTVVDEAPIPSFKDTLKPTLEDVANIQGPFSIGRVSPTEAGPLNDKDNAPVNTPVPVVVVPEGGLNEGAGIPEKPTDPGDTNVQSYDAAPDSANSLVGPLFVKSGMTSFAAPPDTVGAVGKNHFIQMVNVTNFQIYNKSGNPVAGPFSFASLFKAAPCTSNLGDPIVIYDHYADRWVLSQFAQSGATGYMCFAVSKSANPVTSGWWIYAFAIEPLGLPDYPKLAVANIGSSHPSYTVTSYLGSQLGIYGFERNKMINGQAAATVRFLLAQTTAQAGVRDTRVLPVDEQGPPINDSWAYFVRSVDDRQDTADARDRIELFRAIFNFVTPANSSFAKITDIDAIKGLQGFNTLACNRAGGGIRDCIPQPGTADTLDALSNRPMMQAQIRAEHTSLTNNISTLPKEVITFNQTIDARSSFGMNKDVAAIRWYELRSDSYGTQWRIGQQGTYSPQPLQSLGETGLIHRWMGSLAMDKRGNLALGYSVSNSNNAMPVKPGIRVAGRHAADIPGRLGAEKVVVNGSNIQTDGTRRWGDYSAMTVEPDGCTFWFTSHLAPPGSGGRPTSISTFRFPDCWANIGYYNNAGGWKLDTGAGVEDYCGLDGCASGFGVRGDIPVVGDWDGTGWPRIGVYRPSNGWWYLDTSGDSQWSGCLVDTCILFGGVAGDQPIVGDWNGDGRAKIGLYRPGPNQWFLDYDGSNTWNPPIDKFYNQFIGLAGDIAIAGSWTGGTARIGLYRPSTRNFYPDRSGNGIWNGCATDGCWPLAVGNATDQPVIGDWLGQGRDRIGLYRASTGQWFLNVGFLNSWTSCDVDWCLGSFGQSANASLKPVSTSRLH